MANPTQPRLFLLTPRVVFAARVVLLDPAEYPISFVAYDTVTTGAYTDIKPGMSILLGQSAGGDDLGRQRVRGPGAPATAISIFVGRSSRGTLDGELTIVNDAHITVWDDRRVWAKMPFIDADGGIFMDSDLEVGDRTINPPPVANMGAGFAATIDPDSGVITVLHNGQLSFAVADGATITDYLWDIADGALIGGTLTSDNITVTYPPGFRYVKLTVTDSNGKVSFTERPVYARDPDDDTSFDGFAIESHRITDAGQTMTLRALQDMPRATYPDGTLAMIWAREPTGAANRDHILIIGWLDSEDNSHGAGRTGLLRDTTVAILDVAAKLDSLPGLPQALADDETRDKSADSKTPDITWNYMIAPTMDKYIHYLWAWHSTALEVADFMWSGTGSAYAIAIKTSDGESLWNQVARVAQAMCPGYVLTCDQAGRIAVAPDPQLQELADRTSVEQATITEDDWNDLRYTYQRAPRTHWLRAGALVTQESISFNTDGTVFLPTVFSIAPGDTPGQGLGEVDYNEQLAADQDTLNNATGHRYARMNAAMGLITVTLIQDDALAGGIRWREIEPALKQWVVLEVSAETAARRGWPFATIRCLPKEVSVRYNLSRTGLTRTIELTLEPETSGQPGATVLKPIVPAVGDQPSLIPDPIPPPDMGLVTGQQLVAGIGKFGRYKTADFQTPSLSGGPTWVFDNLTGSDEMLTWVVDPFSPGYAPGATSGSVDGWAASATKLYRLTGLFATTPLATAVVTFAHTALWRTVQASFGTYFARGSNPWLICISYYGNLAGHTGTWATYSVDGGATWSDEAPVSSFYDSGGASNPIGLYCSPRTPGLAYTIAHVATANPAETGGYVSTDWGATWTAMLATEDPAFPLPFFAQFVDTNATTATTQTYTTLGRMPRASLSRSDSGTASGNLQWTDALCISPPANVKRVTISGAYVGYHENHGFGTTNHGLTTAYQNPPFDGIGKTVISDVNNGQTGDKQTYTRNFTYQYDFGNFAIHDWPANRDIMEADPSPASSDFAFTFGIGIFSNATISFVANSSLVLTVDEMILDDGTVYVPAQPGTFIPVNSQGGQIHVPWNDNADEGIIYHGVFDHAGNRLFSMHRIDGVDVWDATPSDAGIFYGVNHGHFAVRAHDSDRQLVLLAGTGNDTTSSGANDKQGVFASIDGGDSWTAIVAPTTGTEPYQAAWSGDLDGVVYLWGPSTYFGYSTDSGSSIDSRSGNLSALSATKLIGICGGPTP